MHLPAFQLERYLSRYEFSAPRLLCTSDCESLSIADLLALEDEAKERFMARNLGYTETQGDPELRAGIAGLYAGVSPENVLVSAGAEEAIFLYMNAMLSPGDEIVVQCPAYQSLHEVGRGIGCRIKAWTLSDADGWRPDIERLKDLVTPSTKAIVINSPHNPTGAQMTKEEFFAVKEIAEERGIHVFSDEVYRFLEHDPKDRLPPMADIYEKGVSVGVMSKSFGLAGLRIGWTAAQDTGVLARMAALKDYTTICCSAPSEFLSTLALRHREEIVERNLGIVRENLPLLDRFFARHGDRFSWVRPRAGAIAFPRLLQGSASAFCREAVEEAGVLLLPSETYGYGDSHFRIGFARRDMPAALSALSEFLE